MIHRTLAQKNIFLPYEKKVLVNIGSNTFVALKYWKFAKKVLDPIRTNTFFLYGLIAWLVLDGFVSIVYLRVFRFVSPYKVSCLISIDINLYYLVGFSSFLSIERKLYYENDWKLKKFGGIDLMQY